MVFLWYSNYVQGLASVSDSHTFIIAGQSTEILLWFTATICFSGSTFILGLATDIPTGIVVLPR